LILSHIYEAVIHLENTGHLYLFILPQAESARGRSPPEVSKCRFFMQDTFSNSLEDRVSQDEW